MHDITTTRKMENGVACYYGESGKEKRETFNYQELIDMKINALDLLKDPKKLRGRLQSTQNCNEKVAISILSSFGIPKYTREQNQRIYSVHASHEQAER